ncbi:MAG: hypothetical protein COB98_05180 [Flavobacteriaceae bacterium]|nr:MAG: hypothetical protein COB98_05180 [Flavobacteriaceae bacterium]
MKKCVFVEEPREDYLYCKKNEKIILKRTYTLLKDVSRESFEGIENLKQK